MSDTRQPPGWSVDAATVRRNPYWLIAKHRRGRLEVLTTSLADGRGVLPVFSFEEEAALFLRLGARGSWRVRRTEAGELVSLLYGLCRQVELVALDPVSDGGPEMTNRLVSLEQARFVNVLLHRKAPARLPVGVPSLPELSTAVAVPLPKPGALRPRNQGVTDRCLRDTHGLPIAGGR